MFINDKTLGFIGCRLLYSVDIGVNLPQTERNLSVYSSAEVSHTNRCLSFGTGAELSGHFGTIN